MKFRTEIDIPRPPFRLSHCDRLFAVGSCFAVHTGNRLRDLGFHIQVNPFGTLFNSASVLKLVRYVLGQETLKREDLFLSEGVYKHYDFPGLFNRATSDEFIKNVKETLETQKVFTQNVTVVLLTLGTAQVWVLKETGEVVANCHKQPARLFEKRMQSVEEIVEDLEALRRLFGGVKMVLSVSPVRYLQDGFTANARSKARLLEAVLRFQDRFPDEVFYFPAYEIFMDDLRDYRFYATDLKHPGEQGVAYVLEKFEETFFDKETREINRRVEKFNRFKRHRPLTGDIQAHLMKIRSEKDKLLRDYPFLILDE